MRPNLTNFIHVIAAFPRVLRRRRARGGVTHEQFKDACLIVQICVLVHCFLLASMWWARTHDDRMNWLGVAMAVAWVIVFWWFLLKQAYKALENAVAREFQ